MRFEYATIYAYIAFTAAGSVVFHTLCLRAARRAVETRQQVSRFVRDLRQAA